MRRSVLRWTAALLLLPGVSTATWEPGKFSTDGCSLFPDGTSEQPQLWQSCCVRHDEAYFVGGTRAERSAADRALRDCVAAVCSEPVGDLMLSGVTLGGSPLFATPWRWGYAWLHTGQNDYRVLKPDERQAALAEIDRFWASGGRVDGFDERWWEWHGMLAALPGLRQHLAALSAELDRLGLRCDEAVRRTGFSGQRSLD